MKNIKRIVIIVSLTCIIQSQAQTIVYERHDIETNFDGIKETKMIDLDNDGDLDIVGGSETTPTTTSKGVAWWRNNGENNWERFTIDTSFLHVMSVDAAFIDGDVYPDIVATSWQLNQVAWWKNSGDPTQGWTKYVIKSNFTNAHDAKCVDIDNDGNTDIVAASYGLSSIVVCWNDGNPTSNWQTSTLTNTFGGALSVLIIDLDKDYDLDILGTASDADLISWWENSGSNPINWTYHNIASNFVGSSDLYVLDMNQDELYDIIGNAWKSNQVAYWICNNLQGNSWTKHIVTSQLPVAACVAAGDLDKDEDVDIVAVGKIPGELDIFQNSDFNWTKILLTDDFEGGEDVEVLDMDGDEDLDIVSAASSGKLIWWENQTPVGITNDENPVPQEYYLGQNFPNPFNLSTTISYSIPVEGFTTLNVYDVLGNEITTLVNEEKTAGEYEIKFSAFSLPSGLYFYTLKTGDYTNTKKMILIK
jgi:hypothetical protein